MLKIGRLMIVFVGIVVIMSGCMAKQKRVLINDNMAKKMDVFNARMAIFLNDKGDFIATDINGHQLEPCSIGPNKKGKGRCRGMGKSGEVLSLTPFTFFQAKGSNCTGGVDGKGRAWQICW